jgi:hypothetical protein
MGRRSAVALLAAMLAAATLVVVGEIGRAKGAAALPSNPTTRTSDQAGSGRLLNGQPSNGQAPPAMLGYMPGDPSNYGAAKSALVQGNSAKHRTTTTTSSTTTSSTTTPTSTTSSSTTTSASTTTTAIASTTTTASTTTLPGGSPVVNVGWDGQSQSTVAPPDTTGAVGPSGYIETVNDQYGMYDRAGALLSVNGTPSQGTLTNWTGEPSKDSLTDPQVLWDPGSQRFYYEVLDFTTNDFAYGFSKTATPQSRNDFCHYDWNFGYGSDLPDYPKLGVSSDFAVIGVNRYHHTFFGYTPAGSDVLWIAKPPAGTACPDPATLLSGGIDNLSQTFTPVPAFQTDPSSTGWVVATSSDVSNGSSASSLSLWSFTNSSGSLALTGPTLVGVNTFTLPANAPQPGTKDTIDTLDGRLTHAVSAVDPRLGHLAVWTSHTVFGGAGAQVRWYEIDPVALSILQSGTVSSGSMYAFNAAVSPDRAVSSAGASFGSNMVLTFNTVSGSTYPAIQMVSKRGADAQSGWVMVDQSAYSDVDFTCTSPYGPPCRWGDYSGATPDPGADPLQASGRVWLANQWQAAPDTSPNHLAEWRTHVFEATP